MYSTIILTCFLTFVDATLSVTVDKETKAVTGHIFDNQKAVYNDLFLSVVDVKPTNLQLSGTSMADSEIVSVNVDMNEDFRWGTTQLQYGSQHETVSCIISN